MPKTNASKVTFGYDQDICEPTTLTEMSEYIFTFIEEENSRVMNREDADHFEGLNDHLTNSTDNCLLEVIENALEAFCGGARNT